MPPLKKMKDPSLTRLSEVAGHGVITTCSLMRLHEDSSRVTVNFAPGDLLLLDLEHELVQRELLPSPQPDKLTAHEVIRNPNDPGLELLKKELSTHEQVKFDGVAK